MAEPVVSLEQYKADQKPHKYGYARCIVCNFEYVAVAPVGVHALQCPECKLGQSYFIHPVEADKGDLVWTCAYCGCQAFSHIIRNGNKRFWCVGCGNYITPEDFLT